MLTKKSLNKSLHILEDGASSVQVDMDDNRWLIFGMIVE